jgi:uncharacterized membrane protein
MEKKMNRRSSGRPIIINIFLIGLSAFAIYGGWFLLGVSGIIGK